MIPFEPQIFGTAANNGQMIAEVSASHKSADMFRQLAQVLTGRAEAKRRVQRPALAAVRQAHEAQKLDLRARNTRRLNSCSVSVVEPPKLSVPRHRPPRRPWWRRRCSPRKARQACGPDAVSVRRPRRAAGHSAAPDPCAFADQHRAIVGRYAALGELLRGQGHHLRRFDRGDRSRATGAARRRFRARRNPRHRQRNHLDQEHRDVDFRAGRAARRHLQ